MKLDNFIVQLAILFLPGVVWARLDASWSSQSRPTDTEFFVRAFLFGLTSYALAFLAYSALGLPFEVVDLQKATLFDRSVIGEIAVATTISVAMAIIWIYANTHKIVARTLQRIGATKRFGDEDVWDFTFNSRAKGVGYAHIRDFGQRVVYAGFVDAFSERGLVRELLLHDVVVYDFDGNAMYDVPLLYLARKPEECHIEFPYKQDGRR